MNRSKCGGRANEYQYAKGCRCYGCKDAWLRRAQKRADWYQKSGKGSESRGGKEMLYGFTKNDIIKARGYSEDEIAT